MARKNNNAKRRLLITALFIIGLMAFIYNSKLFEREPPQVLIDETVYWNLKKPLNIKISDQSGIKRILIQLGDGENNITLFNEKHNAEEKELEFNITFPKKGFYSKKNQYIISYEIVDHSFWNFFMGNKIVKESIIIADRQDPLIHVTANSYKITKGGAGIVIFKVEDANPNEVYIQTNFGKKFKAAPFEKEGYYIAPVVWPREQKNPLNAEIVATDLAGNTAREKIKYYIQDKNYKSSKIQLTVPFLNGSISSLAHDIADDETQDMNSLEKFIFINDTLRKESVSTIEEVSDNINYPKYFTLEPFYPLKSSAVVAGYGDFRIYEYDKKKVSESYHLGLDLASTAEADIILSNRGRVVFAGENGIYGKMIIIYHGLGIYSLYGHCSNLLVQEGDEVTAGQIIAKTGKTGFAFGDHLHFGIVIQGVEVRPEEWMDEKWMRDNIFDVINSANYLIESENNNSKWQNN
ncbi:MAG: M23 family metallopeptidase [Campylobacteraceae bacterium]|jgi:murein DD-endopeptidase MepM/ murein hydrolase activator NlpD|nr:M23 family metallopeptidase [Campylobacteraceae bacterium]